MHEGTDAQRTERAADAVLGNLSLSAWPAVCSATTRNSRVRPAGSKHGNERLKALLRGIAGGKGLEHAILSMQRVTRPASQVCRLHLNAHGGRSRVWFSSV